jgi:CheY-like chemotaxis protein
MAVVLIAEDDPDARETLEDFLGDEGYEVPTAADGQKMLEALRASARPMVALIDQYMPRVSARHLIELLYAAPSDLARHAFIFVTGAPYALPAMPVDACPGTFFAVVPKPFELDEINSALEHTAAHLKAGNGL